MPKYLQIAALALLFLENSRGAIIFRSVAPGEIVDNTGTALLNNIDLDGNGIVDFFTSNAGDEATLVPTGNNRLLSIVATAPNLGRSISSLVEGALIGADPSSPYSWVGLADRINEFDNGGASIYRCNGRVQPGQPPECNSSIPANVIRYVGLELDIDGATHYGWVEISSSLNVLHTVRVSGFAYESEPNLAILSGAVPEPSSCFFVISSCFGLFFRRKRC